MMRSCSLSLLVALLCAVHTALALPSLLVFTKTSAGAFRHDSIPTAVDVITRLGTGALALKSDVADSSVANDKAKWNVTHSEDDGPWSDAEYLGQFDAVAFVSTR